MKNKIGLIFSIALLLAACQTTTSSTSTSCTPDNKTGVAAGAGCLVIETSGTAKANPILIIFIHGDGSRGGPSDYMFKYARSFGADNVVSVGMIRPGYFDSYSNYSSGNSYRDNDIYRVDVIESVTAAVTTLKSHYNPKKVILVGHSGGAAISSIILGRTPGLVDTAVLAACPCDVPRWREMRRGYNTWTRSLSPQNFAKSVASDARVIALTGGYDDNTRPVLAQDYVDGLKKRGINATFSKVPEASHNGVLRTDAFTDAVKAALGS